MYAAVAAGIHPDVLSAQKGMGSGFAETYLPNPARVADYQTRYAQYQAFGQFVEQATLSSANSVSSISQPAVAVHA